MLFVKDNLITFPVGGFCFSGKIEIFCAELNLRKQKWLIFCCCNPHKHLIKDHLLQIKSAIDFQSKSYENIILIGDFNVEISESHMNSFSAIYHLKSLIKERTRQFQATLTLDTGLSDFHKMVLAAFKLESPHQKLKMISYRNYKHFNRNNFEKEIKNTLTIFFTF